ncbi:hypothetical protein N7453_008750 [Penicillium expansum]|nr:hypothetical protein N7453_008750 [Penicillium expansum]
MAKLVLDRGLLTIDPESIEAQEGLSHAVHMGMTGVVKRPLERGVDPKVPLLENHPSLLAAATYGFSTDKVIEAVAIILDLLIAHGAVIEEWGYLATTPLYQVMVHIDWGRELDFDQAKVRLLLERDADPSAEHGDYWSTFVSETCDAYANSGSLYRSRQSTHSPDTGASASALTPIGYYPWKLETQYRAATCQERHYDDPFLACMRLGDKAVLKLMLEAIENGSLHFLPILEDYYWSKRYPCK